MNQAHFTHFLKFDLLNKILFIRFVKLSIFTISDILRVIHLSVILSAYILMEPMYKQSME